MSSGADSIHLVGYWLWEMSRRSRIRQHGVPRADIGGEKWREIRRHSPCETELRWARAALLPFWQQQQQQHENHNNKKRWRTHKRAHTCTPCLWIVDWGHLPCFPSLIECLSYTHTHTHTHIYIYTDMLLTVWNSPVHTDTISSPQTYTRSLKETHISSFSHTHTRTHTHTHTHTHTRGVLNRLCLTKLSSSSVKDLFVWKQGPVGHSHSGEDKPTVKYRIFVFIHTHTHIWMCVRIPTKIMLWLLHFPMRLWHSNCMCYV